MRRTTLSASVLCESLATRAAVVVSACVACFAAAKTLYLVINTLAQAAVFTLGRCTRWWARWRRRGRPRRSQAAQTQAQRSDEGGRGGGAAVERQRRLRLLVHVADFFSAFAAKDTAKALQVLDAAGILQHATERIEVTCPSGKFPGNVLHATDRSGRMHAVTVPPGVAQGATFLVDVSSGGSGGASGGVAEQLVREFALDFQAAASICLKLFAIVRVWV